MNRRRHWIEICRTDGLRYLLLGTGYLLIALSPAVGAIPGPGGTFVFVAGLVLVLRNSLWARRRYVLVKRRWPRWGHLVDRTMRRPSALRRHAKRKAPPSAVD